MTAKPKKRNRAAQDATLINLRKANKRIAALEARVLTLEQRDAGAPPLPEAPAPEAKPTV